jgi:hypothetical protein
MRDKFEHDGCSYREVVLGYSMEVRRQKFYDVNRTEILFKHESLYDRYEQIKFEFGEEYTIDLRNLASDRQRI